MIRLKSAVLALATGLLATGAVAQDGHFSQDREGAVVAHELFGGDAVKLVFNNPAAAGKPSSGFEPKAKLIFGGSATIDAGTEFSVTYTLMNATFAQSASFRDFRWGSWGTDTDGADDILADDGNAANGDETADNCMLAFTPLSAEVEITRDGGTRGSDSVKYSVKVLGVDSEPDGTLDTPVAAIGGTTALTTATPFKTSKVDAGTCAASTATTAVDRYAAGLNTRKIVFDLPDVNASGLAAPTNATTGAGAVNVVVTATIEQTKSTGTNVAETVMNGHMCGDLAVAKSPGSAGCPVVEAVKVVTSITSDVEGAGGMISLASADGRKKLVKSDGKAEDPQRAKLATVKVVANLASGARDAGGDPITAFTGDMAGSLAIRVSSENFRDGDSVYIDTNGNKKVDGREEFEIDGETALDTVPLASGNMDVWYVPNGEDALKHRTKFTTTASTEFADTDNRTVSSKAGTATLNLHGIKENVAKAYAIAPLTSTDMANLRVTCEAEGKTGCNVFLDCKDQMGVNTFGEAGAMIDPGATVVWQQMQVAEALGLDDGWEGRLACDVLSSAEITVQVLTRANGVLVNNTATETGGN